MTERLDRQGLGYAFLAYGVWGLFPIFMDQLRPSGSLEIVAHRALWSLVVCLAVVAIARRWRRLWAAIRNPRVLWTLAGAALIIGVNWGVMIYAVLTERVADSSFGYYINPLITVALGVLVLGERLHRAQAVALALAGAAIVLIGVELRGVPWIAPALAITFAAYSLLKKRVGGKVDALTGFTVETLALMPFGAAILAIVIARGDATWATAGASHTAWLASTGLWTSLALMIFAAAAARLPLYVIGLIQYVTPTITFVLAVTYFHEHMPPARWAGFALVWVALAIVSWDTVRRSRRDAAARAAVVVTEPE